MFILYVLKDSKLADLGYLQDEIRDIFLAHCSQDTQHDSTLDPLRGSFPSSLCSRCSLRSVAFNHIFFGTDAVYLVACLCIKIETIDSGICSIFIFLEKNLGIVSSPHLVYDFSRKMHLVLYTVNWPNFIAWLPLLIDNCLWTSLWRHKFVN